MGKLTPEKYALTCALMKLGFDIHSGNEHLVFDAAKAYAAAQVAAKDADLKRITHERDVLCEIRDMSYREIAALKADKERMREGISDIDIIMDDSNLSISEARHAVFSKVQSLLSPADDTYDSGKWGTQQP